MRVEVRPIERKKWHGKSGKEAFTSPLVLEALYDPNTGGYATGLSDADRKRLEKATGFDLSPDFDPEKPHPFWNSSAGRIKLPWRTNIFDTSKPLDEIKVKVLKASKYVANSMKEYEEGKYPEAIFVIYDEAEEVAIKASKVQKRNKAIKLVSKMSLDSKVNIIQILAGKSLRKQSQDFVDVEMDNLIETMPDKVIKYAEMDKAEVYLRAAVLEALHRNILTKEGNAVYYMGDRIADTTDDAVEYFKDPNNQKLKAMILEKLND